MIHFLTLCHCHAAGEEALPNAVELRDALQLRDVIVASVHLSISMAEGVRRGSRGVTMGIQRGSAYLARWTQSTRVYVTSLCGYTSQ
jgi:hypothetical protein